MRTSLRETKQIEDWLLHEITLPDRLVMEANIIISPALQENIMWQQHTYDVIQAYGRALLVQEIKEVEDRLFHSSAFSAFQKRIKAIFKK